MAARAVFDSAPSRGTQFGAGPATPISGYVGHLNSVQGGGTVTPAALTSYLGGLGVTLVAGSGVQLSSGSATDPFSGVFNGTALVFGPTPEFSAAITGGANCSNSEGNSGGH